MASWPSVIPTFATGIGGITVTKMNQLRDALKAQGDAWSTFTPTWTATSVAPTMGASTVAGRYRQVGQTWDIHYTIVIGAGFAAGTGGYVFSFPPGFAPLLTTATGYLGAANGKDVSAPTSRGFHAYYFASVSFALFQVDTGAVVGAAAPWAWNVGDTLDIHLTAVESA